MGRTWTRGVLGHGGKGMGGRRVSLESLSLREQTPPTDPRKTAFPGDSGKGGPCSAPARGDRVYC